MITLEKCIEHIKKGYPNSVLINGWVIKTEEDLLSGQENLHMGIDKDSNGLFKARSSSFIRELEEHPENCHLISIDGDYDTDNTDEIVCPYCGHEGSDSWEYSRDSGEIECGRCCQEFNYNRDVSVSYSTSKRK
jgi:hypothetical protein